VPRTLHWFFSLGTARFPASYGLTPDLRERLRSVFPSARPPLQPLDESEPVPLERLARTRAATSGLLHLLGPPEGLDLRFHLLATEEVQAGTESFRNCVEDAPGWARSALGRSDAGDGPLGAREPSTIRDVVRRVLRVVRDGDLVFFDATNGLRPFMFGLLLSQSVLRAARPGVDVLGAVYGELGAVVVRPPERVPEGVRALSRERDAALLSPLYDLTEFVDLPLWASAAEDLRRRFDGRALSDLLRDEQPGLADELVSFAGALDLGWPDELAGPLLEVTSRLATSSGLSPGRRAVLDLARHGLADLEDLPPAGEALDAPRVRFHVEVARFLARAGRFGDAIRILREALVSWAVLVRADGGPVSNWKDLNVRREAERALFRASSPVRDLWRETTELRNAASHGRLTAGQDVEPGDFVRALGRGDGPLLTGAESLLAGGHDDALPVESGFEVAWFVEGDFTGPVAGAEEAIRAFDPTGAVPLVLVGAASSRPEGARTITPSNRVLGSNWAARKARKVRGASDAVLVLPSCPGALALLAPALVNESVRPWSLHGDRLWPLFDRSMAG